MPSGGNSLPFGTVDGEFHIYRMEWTATEVKYYIDGVLKTTIVHASWWDLSVNKPPYVGGTYTLPFYFRVDLQIDSSAQSSYYPQNLIIDYIRVYEQV